MYDHSRVHNFPYDPIEALQAIVLWRAIRSIFVTFLALKLGLPHNKPLANSNMLFSRTHLTTHTQPRHSIPVWRSNMFHPQSQLMPDLISIHQLHGLQTHSPCLFFIS